MPLTDHLGELRKHLIKIILYVAVGFAICYSQGSFLSELLLQPLREALGDAGGKVVYLGILDKVLSQFQLGIWAGIILSSPFWFWEAWKFIEPALYPKEKKAIGKFVLGGFFLFWIGVAFGYFIVFPLTFQTLMSFGAENIEATISLKDYIILSIKVLVFLGLIFQLPNLMVILGFMGLVTKYSLSSYRRFVYVGFMVVAAILTPPDVLTMGGLWVPLVCLYECGIIAVAVFVHPFLKKQTEEEENN